MISAAGNLRNRSLPRTTCPFLRIRSSCPSRARTGGQPETITVTRGQSARVQTWIYAGEADQQASLIRMTSVVQVHLGPPAQTPSPSAPDQRRASGMRHGAPARSSSRGYCAADANSGRCHGGVYAGSVRVSRTAQRPSLTICRAGALPRCDYPARFTVAYLLHRRAMRGHRAGV